MAEEKKTTFAIEDIMKVLPHRYPFLLVDRIIEIEPMKRIVGIKNVTINEPFFQGHFPGHPIMPGVLIIEALAQAAAAAGFADQSHLTRHFAARFGLTPGRWSTLVRAA